MDKFTTAITVLAVIIALGQLVLSIATLSTNKRTAITNWIAWRFASFLLALLAALGMWGLFSFVLISEPEKMDYYRMAVSVVSVGMAFSVYLFNVAIRYTRRLAFRIDEIELLLSYQAEEGSV